MTAPTSGLENRRSWLEALQKQQASRHHGSCQLIDTPSCVAALQSDGPLPTRRPDLEPPRMTNAPGVFH